MKNKYKITIGGQPLKAPQYKNLNWKEAEKQARIILNKPEIHKYKQIDIKKHNHEH